jgi:hypothetical protein
MRLKRGYSTATVALILLLLIATSGRQNYLAQGKSSSTWLPFWTRTIVIKWTTSIVITLFLDSIFCYTFGSCSLGQAQSLSFSMVLKLGE